VTQREAKLLMVIGRPPRSARVAQYTSFKRYDCTRGGKKSNPDKIRKETVLGRQGERAADLSTTKESRIEGGKKREKWKKRRHVADFGGKRGLINQQKRELFYLARQVPGIDPGGSQGVPRRGEGDVGARYHSL